MNESARGAALAHFVAVFCAGDGGWTMGTIPQPDGYSDKAGAHKGTTDIYAPAVSCSGTMAKGSGRPRPAAYITSETTCDAEWHELL